MSTSIILAVAIIVAALLICRAIRDLAREQEITRSEASSDADAIVSEVASIHDALIAVSGEIATVRDALDEQLERSDA